mmetsp:Transcript_26890/g.77526  ORF Transcript_26890/g.77526 Transcript_26890/m.77526 type:complete len:206 (-) Transcript_26890:84-701(-)
MCHELIGRGEGERILLFLFGPFSPLFNLLLNIDRCREDGLVGIVPCKFVRCYQLLVLFRNNAPFLLMLVTGRHRTRNFRYVMRIMLRILQLWQTVGVCHVRVPLRLEIVQRFVRGTFNGNGQTAREGGRRHGKGRTGEDGLAHSLEGGHRGGYPGKEHVGIRIWNMCLYSMPWSDSFCGFCDGTCLAFFSQAIESTAMVFCSVFD